MASVQQTLRNPFYRNWVKGGLVLKFARDGIQCFADDATQGFQQNCLNGIWARKGLAKGTVCNLCTTKNVLPCPTRGVCIVRRGVCNYHDNNDPLKTYRPCPSGICNDLQEKIAKSHRFDVPSWRNTNALLWCSNSWQIAKCFMTADGYSSVSSAAETDFPGLVSVVINLNDVQNMVTDDLSQKNNLFSQARFIRNDILHTASFELTDVVLNGYIDTMIMLLNDPGHLARDINAQSSITKLNEIKTDSMTVTNEDERVIREQALKTIDEKKEDLILEGTLQLTLIQEKTRAKKEEIKQEVSLQVIHIQEKADEKKEKIKQEGLLQMSHFQEKADEKKEKIKQEGLLQMSHIQEKADEKKEKIKQEVLLQMSHIQEKTDEKKEELKHERSLQVIHIQVKAAEKEEEIKKEGILQMKNIEDKAEEKKNKIIKKLKAETAFTRDNELRAYADAKRKMQTELMTLYKENYIKESIFPLRPEEEDTDINETYVEPHIELVDLQSKLKTDNIGNKTIDSYKDIFYTDSNLCKRIYFTGKAGMGKTAFCKRLISSWCNAHSKLPTSQVCNDGQSVTGNTRMGKTSILKRYMSPWCNVHLKRPERKVGNDEQCLSEITTFIDNDTSPENTGVMLNFAFLFYVSLRHAGPDIEIEEMIKNQLLLQKKDKFILTDILEKEPEQCLIILDGLDEWSPPVGHRQTLPYVTKKLPARSTTTKCSILTTTRPWKLEVLKLKPKEIDKQVECLGLGIASADKCIESVIAILNSRRGQSRDPKEFIKELNIRNLNDIKSVPLLLKQLICLWHAGKSFDNSKCVLYSEIINLMFELANTCLVGNPELTYIKEKNQNLHLCLPKCFDGVKLCQEFRSLIYYLSKLSFKTLMKKNKESTLVFDSSNVKRYGLSESEIDICLKIGILSQSKVISAECTRRKSFSFIHKTFQEFLAAVFVSVNRDSSDDIIKTICSNINTVDDVLQQSEFLVFVSGMFPEILYKLTEHIYKVFSWNITKNELIILPMIFIGRINLITEFLLESIHNGVKNVSVNIKTCEISDTLLEKLVESIRHNKCLQNAVLQLDSRTSDAVVRLLKHSKDTICSLSIQLYITSEMLTQLNNLKNLISLGIDKCNLSHTAITYLYTYVTRTTQLQIICLESIQCLNKLMNTGNSHCRRQHDTDLDFSNHQQLLRLTLHSISHVCTVNVKKSTLQYCDIDMKYVECLKDAPNLKHLSCPSSLIETGHSLVSIVPTLVQLKELMITQTNFGDSELRLSPNMKNIERVLFISCSKTSKALRGFVDSITHTRNSVRVHFFNLRITPADETARCLEYIKSRPRFKVIYSVLSIKTGSLGVEFTTVSSESE